MPSELVTIGKKLLGEQGCERVLSERMRPGLHQLLDELHFGAVNTQAIADGVVLVFYRESAESIETQANRATVQSQKDDTHQS